MVYRYVVSLNYPQGGGPGANIWHFRALSQADTQPVIDAIEAFYVPLLPFFQQGMQVVGPDEAVNGIEGDSPEYEPQTGFTLTSTDSGPVAPPMCQAVVGWRTASATRSGRGRTFVGPFGEDSIDTNGSLSAALLTACNAAGQTVVDFNDSLGNGAIGVWSPTQNVLRDITGRRVRDQFAVLRSRRD